MLSLSASSQLVPWQASSLAPPNNTPGPPGATVVPFSGLVVVTSVTRASVPMASPSNRRRLGVVWRFGEGSGSRLGTGDVGVTSSWSNRSAAGPKIVTVVSSNFGLYR